MKWSILKLRSGLALPLVCGLSQISMADDTAIQVEQQGRLMEHSLKLQMLEAQATKVGGIRSSIRAGGLSVKIMELQLATELFKAKVKATKEEMDARYESRQNQVANRIRMVKSQEIRAVTAKSGRSRDNFCGWLQSLLNSDIQGQRHLNEESKMQFDGERRRKAFLDPNAERMKEIEAMILEDQRKRNLAKEGE